MHKFNARGVRKIWTFFFFFFLIGAVVISGKFGRDQRQGRRYLFRSNSAYETDQSLSTHKYPLRSDNSKFPRYLGYTPSSQHSSERAQQRLWEIYSTRQWHGEKDEASTAVNREETGWKRGEGRREGGGITARPFHFVVSLASLHQIESIFLVDFRSRSRPR